MRSELDTNLKEAIKSQEKQRVATLRLINAAIKDRDIAVRSEENTEGVSDAEIILILSNMVKQRKHSIIQYEEGGRIELAEREREEIKIIQEFLPNQLTDEEIHIEISNQNYDAYSRAQEVRALAGIVGKAGLCLLYTSPSPRDRG